MSEKQQRILEQLFQVGKEKKKGSSQDRDVDISLEHKELIRINREGRIYGERHKWVNRCSGWLKLTSDCFYFSQ